MRGAAVAGDQAELGVVHLALAALAAQLAHAFADVAEAREVAFGDQAAGGVRRQRAAEAEVAGRR